LTEGHSRFLTSGGEAEATIVGLIPDQSTGDEGLKFMQFSRPLLELQVSVMPIGTWIEFFFPH
jgi:hypothetical protein